MKFENLTNSLSKLTKGKVNEANIKNVCGGFGVLLVLIIALIALSLGNSQGMGKDSKAKKTDNTGESLVAGTEESELMDEVREVEEIPLEENKYPELNTLVSNYFDAMAQGDMDAVMKIEYPMPELKRLTISARSEYIENFEGLSVYTKPGPKEDTMIAFVYSEVRFKGFDTTAAGIYTLYVSKKEDGSYYFYGGELNEQEEEYVKQVAQQQDVVDLFTKADVKYQESIDSDPQLAEMLNGLRDKLKESVGDAVVSAETEETVETVVEETQEQEVVEEPEKEIDYENVKAKETVNVRMAASEDADKLGKLAGGDIVKRKESLENGWSCIEYEDKTGYVKSEYLTVDSVVYKDGTSTGDGEQPQAETKKVSPTTTVNVRSSASENADKIGKALEGESYELIEVLENGWTKIRYEGKEAFVKSEFLK